MAFTDMLKPKWKHSDFLVRKAAAEGTSDQAVLTKIVKGDTNHHVRQAALSRITDQAFLVELVKQDSDQDVRRTATKNVTDQAVLVQLARSDRDVGVRVAAVKRVADQTILGELARQYTENSVRTAAIECISDPSVLRTVREFFETSLSTEDTRKRREVLGIVASIGDANSIRRLVAAAETLGPGDETHFVDCGGRALVRRIVVGEGSKRELLTLLCERAPEQSKAGSLCRELLRAFPTRTPDDREVVRAWLQSPVPAIQAYVKALLGPDEDLPQDERELVEMVKAVAQGKVDVIRLTSRTTNIGEAAIPILKRLLEKESSGEMQRAVMRAVAGLSFTEILPMAEKALKSSYPGARYYAAIWLAEHSSPEARTLAQQQLRTETDSDVKNILRNVK